MGVTAVGIDGNKVMEEFGDSLIYTTNREKRIAMTSPLYDLPGRSSIGFEVVRATMPELIRRIDPLISPEEIGTRMGQPLMRPYFLQLFIVIEGYVLAREQRILDGLDDPADAEWAARDAADSALVSEWFGRVCSTYRKDGALMPARDVKSQPILEREVVEELATNLRTFSADEVTRAQRAFGAFELYALTLHGEQRDGNFDHGPYRRLPGEVLVFHEINDLHNDYLPWSGEDVRLPADAVGVLRSHDETEAETEFNLFGTMNYVDPSVTARERCFWIRRGDELTEASIEELEEVAAEAARATTLLYKTISTWDADYRTRYGGQLFANHLVPFIRMAGDPRIEAWFREAIDEAAAREMPRFDGNPRSIWKRFAEAGRGSDLIHRYAA